MSSKLPKIADLLPALRGSIDQVSTRLSKFEKQGGSRCFVFAGADRDVGTTVLAAATAMKIATYDQKSVIHVETDIRAPRLHGYLGIPATPGFSEILAGKATLKEALHEVAGAPLLRAVPGGTARQPAPGELAMDQGRIALGEVRRQADFVFLDSAPIIESPESKTLMGVADGIVLVTRARSSRRELARKAIEAYELTGVPILGVVLNRYKPEKIFGL